MSKFNLLKPLQLATGPSIALLLLRLVVGLAFIYHGYGKIPRGVFSWMPQESGIPGVFQMLAVVAECGGGVAWMLGLVTPLASVGLLVTMVVAVYYHASAGHPFVGAGGGPSYELAAVYLCVSLLLLLAGPGRFSLDRVFFGERGGA
jgi:putative oxidoreductase